MQNLYPIDVVVGHTGEIHQTEGISVNQLRDDTGVYADTLQARAYSLLTEWLEQVMVDTSE